MSWSARRRRRCCALGFRPVGRDFPVFLHPETREEYALARTERKTAPGYHGFVFTYSPDVTLEQDLERRDLTINAMARDADGALIDPLRRRARSRGAHAAPRVATPSPRIRCASCASRASSRATRRSASASRPRRSRCMRAMVDAGEVDALVPERVWQETRKALAEPRRRPGCAALRECGALARICFRNSMRSTACRSGRSGIPRSTPALHMELVMQAAAALTAEPRIALRRADARPRQGPHAALAVAAPHRPRGVRRTRSSRRCASACACRPTTASSRCSPRAGTALVHRALELRPRTVLELLESCDAFRRPERFRELLLACEADHRGRGGLAGEPYPQADRLREAQSKAAAISLSEADREGLAGEKIGELLRRRRLAAHQGRLIRQRARRGRPRPRSDRARRARARCG